MYSFYLVSYFDSSNYLNSNYFILNYCFIVTVVIIRINSPNTVLVITVGIKKLFYSSSLSEEELQVSEIGIVVS